MSDTFEICSRTVQKLYSSITQLEREIELLRLPPLAGREWFEVLRQKLLPQLRDDAFLVVAVVGGTNIGKSVIFNHLAGCRASSTSPLASGTKHPVCLVPAGFAETHRLEDIFQGFELQEWTSSEAALELSDSHFLFWRDSEHTPENLLVLDTPDIDSDAPVNWQRADGIRRSADVLIAVLTQQKYNDAVVKEFFRKAASEDKAVIVVFNQCQLPDDEEYWSIWLNTFTEETGINPEHVYLAPNDRKAAEENRLPFYHRDWPPGEVSRGTSEERSLTADLSQLHFTEVKLRTLRGAINRIADQGHGIPNWLEEVKQRSDECQAAAGMLVREKGGKLQDWPAIPNNLLVQEIRHWWKVRQEGWAKKVNRFYDSVGQGVAWPFRFVRDRIQGEPEPPLEKYREAEWSAILKTVEDVFDRLNWMCESGGHLLRPRFEQLMQGKSRQELLTFLKERHRQVDLEFELRRTVEEEMESFQTNRPEAYKFYKQVQNVSAAVRPVTSAVLFSLGWGPGGEVVAPAIADATAHAVIPIIADFAGGTTAAVAGDATISNAAGQGSSYLQVKFQNLQTGFTTRRVLWLAEIMKEELLGTLPEELQAAADVPHSQTYLRIQSLLTELQGNLLDSDTVPTVSESASEPSADSLTEQPQEG